MNVQQRVEYKHERSVLIVWNLTMIIHAYWRWLSSIQVMCETRKCK